MIMLLLLMLLLLLLRVVVGQCAHLLGNDELRLLSLLLPDLRNNSLCFGGVLHKAAGAADVHVRHIDAEQLQVELCVLCADGVPVATNKRTLSSRVTTKGRLRRLAARRARRTSSARGPWQATGRLW